MTLKIEIPMLKARSLSLKFDDKGDDDCWDVRMVKMVKGLQNPAVVYVGRVSKNDLKRVTKAS